MIMLTTSIVLNVLLLFFVGYLIYDKGGFSYLVRRVRGEYRRRICRGTDHHPIPKDFYSAKVSLLEVLPRTRDDIIFLGDSMTYAVHWNELLNNPKVRNRGLPGDNTGLMLSRLDRIIGESPRQIFIMAGINDLRQALAVSHIVSRYTEILKRLSGKIPRTEIYIQSVLPVNDALYAVGINNEEIVRLNEQLKSLAALYGAIYIDLFSLFTDRNGQLHRKYTSHGIHLNGRGYLIWKAAIESYVYREQPAETLPIDTLRGKQRAIGPRATILKPD